MAFFETISRLLCQVFSFQKGPGRLSETNPTELSQVDVWWLSSSKHVNFSESNMLESEKLCLGLEKPNNLGKTQ